MQMGFGNRPARIRHRQQLLDDLPGLRSGVPAKKDASPELDILAVVDPYPKDSLCTGRTWTHLGALDVVVRMGGKSRRRDRVRLRNDRSLLRNWCLLRERRLLRGRHLARRRRPPLVRVM
jgi:hypothetical protein